MGLSCVQKCNSIFGKSLKECASSQKFLGVIWSVKLYVFVFALFCTVCLTLVSPEDIGNTPGETFTSGPSSRKYIILLMFTKHWNSAGMPNEAHFKALPFQVTWTLYN